MSLFLKQVEDTYEITTAGYSLFIAVMLAALIVACFFTGKDKKNHFSVKQLVFTAMCITLAMVTSMIHFFDLPMGGSVTLFSMFFITYVGYLYGLRAGLTSALAYGVLQLIVNPYIISVPQLLCDYFLAFGAMGLAGLFYNKKHGMEKGYVVGILGRFVFSVLSGVIFFSSYAPAGMHPLVYSIAYNGSYIGAEAVITLILISIPAVHKALNRIRVMANEEEVRDVLAQN